MSGSNWQLSGEYMESCNIDDGHSGSINLDGLCFALLIRSGKVMADGNWIFAGVVDAQANGAQRKALASRSQLMPLSSAADTSADASLSWRVNVSHRQTGNRRALPVRAVGPPTGPVLKWPPKMGPVA
jgi:hypothetical protein